VIEHSRLQVAGYGPFRATGLQSTLADQRGQCGVGGLAGQPQQGHLAGVLDLAQGLDRAGGPHQVRTRIFGQHPGKGLESVDRDDVALESDATCPAGQCQLPEMPGARPFNGDMQVRGLSGRLGPVPGVGGQHREGVVGEHQQRRVGTGESGQIADIDKVTHQ